jgi:hypothetical protein
MLLGALGRWGQGHRVAQALEAVDEAPFHCLTIPLIEVIASQVAVDGPLCQHVIGNDQDGVGDGDGRLRPTTASRQSSVLRCEIGAFGAGRCVRCLNQARPQPRTPLACPAATAVPSALVVAGTQPRRLRACCKTFRPLRASGVAGLPRWSSPGRSRTGIVTPPRHGKVLQHLPKPPCATGERRFGRDQAAGGGLAPGVAHLAGSRTASTTCRMASMTSSGCSP